MLACRFVLYLKVLFLNVMGSVPAIDDIDYLFNGIVRVLLELGDGLLKFSPQALDSLFQVFLISIHILVHDIFGWDHYLL